MVSMSQSQTQTQTQSLSQMEFASSQTLKEEDVMEEEDQVR